MKKNRKDQRSQKPLTAGKKLLFGTVTLLLPIVLLFLLETGLRLGGYGTNLALFAREEVGGKMLYVMNPDVKGRYFTHIGFSPNTSLDYFEMPKTAGAFRIFCLGGSTTVGFPYGYIGSFSTFLRQRMQTLFPERKIEIINLGMTATNSFTVLDIMKELFDYEPDLIIVYDGHNEFYGALGVASHESVGGSRWLTNLYLRLTRCKTFELLRHLLTTIEGAFGKSAVPKSSGTMMESLASHEYIPYGSPAYRTCLSNFEANLEEISSLATSHKVPLILSTQVSNERDLPPFVSQNREGFSKENIARYNLAVDSLSGRTAQLSPDAAETLARRLIGEDSLRADVHFYLAKALMARGSATEAGREFRIARDFDQLRFRASADFNNAIRARIDTPFVYVADIERDFASLSPDSIVGTNLILEHLHPNLSGYFLIGKCYAHLLKTNGIAFSRDLWTTRDTIADDTYWKQAGITSFDLRAADKRMGILTGSWPFRHPLPSSTLPLPNDVEAVVNRLIAGKMTWEEAHVAAAELYAKQKDFVHAEAEYFALVDQFPSNVSAFLFLSKLYLEQHHIEQAKRFLTRSLEAEQTPIAYRMLSTIALDSGRTDQAISLASRALDLSREPEEELHSRYALALAFYRSRDTVRSLQEVEQALAISPSFPPARGLRNLLQK